MKRLSGLLSAFLSASLFLTGCFRSEKPELPNNNVQIFKISKPDFYRSNQQFVKVEEGGCTAISFMPYEKGVTKTRAVSDRLSNALKGSEARNNISEFIKLSKDVNSLSIECSPEGASRYLNTDHAVQGMSETYSKTLRDPNTEYGSLYSQFELKTGSTALKLRISGRADDQKMRVEIMNESAEAAFAADSQCSTERLHALQKSLESQTHADKIDTYSVTLEPL